MEAKVDLFLNQKRFSFEGTKCLVGVSGGPDSLALLNYLLTKQQELNFSLVVGHLDHMFRGSESFEDARFVKLFCEARNIPFEMEQINVPEYMKKTGRS